MSNIRYTWPMGNLWVYHADIVNDASNSGDHRYSVVPGDGEAMEILYGGILNGDSSSRTGNVWIRDALTGNDLTRLMNETLGAAAFRSFPTVGAGDSVEAQGGRFLVYGNMALVGEVLAVAVSQDSAFALAALVRGALPTVTLVSPTDATETVNTNAVQG